MTLQAHRPHSVPIDGKRKAASRFSNDNKLTYRARSATVQSVKSLRSTDDSGTQGNSGVHGTWQPYAPVRNSE